MDFDKLAHNIDRFLDYWFSGRILKSFALISIGYFLGKLCD